jgi:hypothetical protein
MLILKQTGLDLHTLPTPPTTSRGRGGSWVYKQAWPTHQIEGVGPLMQDADLSKRVIHACLYTPKQGSSRLLSQRWGSESAVVVLSCSTYTRPPIHVKALTATTRESSAGLDRDSLHLSPLVTASIS